MRCQNEDCRCSDENPPLTSAKEIQARKSDLLFQYLRDVQKLNQQMKLLQISEEIERINGQQDRELGDLLVREGR